ncbi:hypothetical protein Lfu02_12890 [Longispora fulva]|uniref:Septal ring-binding cell division protein DamX n=1 Tax=Longispora fulva TaxID=619741 RepID=A0A8J7GQ42_9ACTN|nr:hypothetical protein [Longispora fulva]MBG6134851.1 septal ring-binding cell division protein DamX [Longispora fulva]GIG56917.1 hypothetical protein Lfu02_12890 [Longispora fulva]
MQKRWWLGAGIAAAAGVALLGGVATAAPSLSGPLLQFMTPAKPSAPASAAPQVRPSATKAVHAPRTQAPRTHAPATRPPASPTAAARTTVAVRPSPSPAPARSAAPHQGGLGGLLGH